ncbi:hypothetical protein WJX73_003811 [Symbiochloris irregularis]|uniref:Protein TEX261 n=1 Tax=Symbiochloris irregularis TaxID=706552 RepID=A0AAW1PV89_9CHLO
MYLATVVTWFGAYFTLVFCCISVAMGVYYLAELVEEFTMLTRRLLNVAVKAELVMHLLLLVVDRGPVLPLVISAAAQASYFRLLPGFPFLRLTSEPALTSSGLLLAAQGMWARHFYLHHRSIEFAAGFCLVTVWLVPCVFLLSLSANESVLPGAPGNLPPASGGSKGSKANRSMLKEALGFLQQKGQSILPRMAPSALSNKPHRI